MNIPCDLAIMFICKEIYPREMKTCLQRALYPNVHSSLICNHKKLGTVYQQKEGVSKWWHIQTVDYYSAETSSNMNESQNLMSERYQTERNTYCKFSFM